MARLSRTAAERLGGVCRRTPRDSAPRDSASIPMAPLPAKRSATASPSRSTMLPSTSKIDSRTRSEVGRVAVPAGARRGRPRQVPAMTRTRPQRYRRPAARRWPTRRLGGRGQVLSRKAASASPTKSRTSSARLRCEPQGGVLGEQVLGHLPGRGHQGPVATPQRRQLQIAAALLARAQDRTLAPQLEVDLGQLEAVGAAFQGLEAHRRVGRRRAGEQVAPRRPVATGPPDPAAGGAGRCRSGRRPRRP